MRHVFPMCHWSGGAATRFKSGDVNGFLARGADLTGNVDSKLLLFSFWFKLVDEDSAATIYATSRDPASSPFSAANAIQWPVSGPIPFRPRSLFRAPDETIILIVRTITQIRAGDGWQHLMGSFDMASTAKRHHLLNDVSDAVYTTYLDDVIDFTKNDHGVGNVPDAPTDSSKGNICIAHLYLNFGVYMNLDIEANARKFITADGTPADLLDDGSGPTGSPPIVYLRGNAANIVTNRGTGGNLLATSGPIFDCADAP